MIKNYFVIYKFIFIKKLRLIQSISINLSWKMKNLIVENFINKVDYINLSKKIDFN